MYCSSRSLFLLCLLTSAALLCSAGVLYALGWFPALQADVIEGAALGAVLAAVIFAWRGGLYVIRKAAGGWSRWRRDVRRRRAEASLGVPPVPALSPLEAVGQGIGYEVGRSLARKLTDSGALKKARASRHAVAVQRGNRGRK